MEMGSAVSSYKLQILLLVVMMMMMTIGGTDGANTCTAKTTTSETSVTCDFGRDISETQEAFNIRFYFPDTGADSETMLMCNWVAEDENTGLICQKSEGVEFNKVVSHRLTFTAPPAVDKVGGKYVCQMVPSMDVPIKPCVLTYSNDVRTTTQLPDFPEEDERDVTRLIEKIDAKAMWVLVLGICALSVNTIVVVVFIIYICCQRVTRRIPWCRREGAEEKGKVGNGELPGNAMTTLTSSQCHGTKTAAVDARQVSQGPSGDVTHDDVRGDDQKTPAKKRGWFRNLFRRSRDDVEKTWGGDQPLMTMTESTQIEPVVTDSMIYNVEKRTSAAACGRFSTPLTPSHYVSRGWQY